MRDLASCSRVSRKWQKSQTLNYGTLILLALVALARSCEINLTLFCARSVVQTLSQRQLPGGRFACGKVDAPRIEAKLGGCLTPRSFPSGPIVVAIIARADTLNPIAAAGTDEDAQPTCR